MVTVGAVVHVRDEDGQRCRPAVVLSCIVDVIEARVLYRGPVTEPVGSRDGEGRYQPFTRRITAARPGGGYRFLDSWHEPGDGLADCEDYPG